jgi:hypothetical protein
MLNQVSPNCAVMPAAMKLIATPETIWLPRCVMEAKPWTSAKKTEARMAPKRPSQAEPVMPQWCRQ